MLPFLPAPARVFHLGKIGPVCRPEPVVLLYGRLLRLDVATVQIELLSYSGH